MVTVASQLALVPVLGPEIEGGRLVSDCLAHLCSPSPTDSEYPLPVLPDSQGAFLPLLAQPPLSFCSSAF